MAKMLYIPNKFELFETKNIDIGSCVQRNKSMNYSKQRHPFNSIDNKIIPPSITIKSIVNK